MACMKCGRNTQECQVFCDSCIEIMEWYPVKPGTAVQLPRRRETPVRKTVKRRGPSLEEQVKHLRKVIRLLIVALILAVILIALMAFPTYEHLSESLVIPGQNYSTVRPLPLQPTETIPDG